MKDAWAGTDVLLKRFQDLGINGVRMWNAGFGNNLGKVSPADVSVLDDPATSEACGRLTQQNLRILGNLRSVRKS